MTPENSSPPDSPLDGIKRYVPLLASMIVILVILAIPLKIISYGYLPGDDALRHAAKAVSGKPWPDILVLSDSYKIDYQFGWHLLLRQVHAWTHADAEGLVVFSIVVLFAVVGWMAVLWLKRPEAWLAALLLLAVSSG